MPDLSHLRTLLVTLATLSLFACQSQTVRDGSIPPERTKRPEAKILEDPRVIGLLESARYDYDQDRLTTPIDNNAYYKYLRVLSISPNNGKANQGIAEIVEKYLAWAMNAADQGQFRKALSYVAKANSVDEDHLNIGPVEALVKKRQGTIHKNFNLSEIGLNARTNSITEYLKTIAQTIETYRASIVIYAKTDEDARWIYQQLNNFTENRIRATFEKGAQPKVRISYQ